jgi:hypothetical protein
MTKLHLLDPDINCEDDSVSCFYYSASEFYNNFVRYIYMLRVRHLNIRSVHKNMDEFLLFVQSLSAEFHALILTETWLEDQSYWLNIPGYTAYHSIRPNRRGGGVTVLVNSLFKSEQLPKYTVSDNLLEMCSGRVRLGDHFHNFFGVYRPPNQSLVEFNECIFNLVCSDNAMRGNCYFLGDFKVDLVPEVLPNCASVYISEFRQLSCVQSISVPTCVKNNPKP